MSVMAATRGRAGTERGQQLSRHQRNRTPECPHQQHVLLSRGQVG